MLTTSDVSGFLSNMLKAYRLSRCARVKNAKAKVVRGRAHCVAGIFEDAFASLVCKKILWKKEVGFVAFTDFPLTIAPPFCVAKKEYKTRYVDFLLCKKTDDTECEILYMAELKTNTGWIRGKVPDRIKENGDFLRHLKNRKTVISARGETLKDVGLASDYSRYRFSVSPQCRYDLIVLSGTNAGDSLKELRRIRKDAPSSLIILTDDSISWRNPRKTVPVPREEDCTLLDERIRKCIGHKKGLR